jgi:hypothetical protein
MGRIKKGILGNFAGKVGTVAGSTWKGIGYMRSLPESSGGDPSPAQLAHRAKFAFVIKFLKSLTGLLEFSFNDEAIHQSGFNAAMSHTMKSAVVGVAPNLLLSYPQVLVSRGSLPNAGGPAAAAGTAGKIVFTWTDNTGLGKAQSTDRAILVAYSPDLDISAYTIAHDMRSSGTSTLNVVGFNGKTVQTWISFLAADGSEIATSLYTGPVNVV